MTTVITRLFPDTASAQSAAKRLTFKGIPKRACIVIDAGEGAAARMERADVHPSAIGPYSEKLASGKAVLVVQTTYKPLGAAQLTRDILEKRETIAVEDVVEDHFVKSRPDKAPSVLKDHPHMLLMHDYAPSGHVSASLGMSMLKPHKTKRPLIAHSKRISRMFWPMALVSKKRRTPSVMRGGRYMSRAFWPMPLLSKAPRRKSVMPDGSLPFSNAFSMKTTTSLR